MLHNQNINKYNTEKMSLRLGLLNSTKVLLSRSILSLAKPFTIGFADDKSQNDRTDFYDTLGLKSSATNAEIKKAYYDLTMKYHPDRNEGDEDASKKFREVAEAYEVLGNYGMRKRYDKGLPLPLVKKQSVGRSPIVEKELKYQKFFDSRDAHRKYDWQSKEDEEVQPSRLEQYFEERRKRIDAEAKEAASMQYLVAAFLGIAFILIQFVFKRQ